MFTIYKTVFSFSKKVEFCSFNALRVKSHANRHLCKKKSNRLYAATVHLLIRTRYLECGMVRLLKEMLANMSTTQIVFIFLDENGADGQKIERNKEVLTVRL